MTPENADTHERAIRDQFSRQAVGFAAAPELHADDIVALVVDAAKPQPEDNAIDLACGPGTVACALAPRVRHVVGLDSTLPMLEQARGFARRQSVDNVEWRAGDVYQTPFADGSFNIVSCRFAFHHFAKPALAFAEMVRLAATGGRVVVCDGLASEEPAKAEAFNAMERRRDPSTVEFRTLPYLRRLKTLLQRPLGMHMWSVRLAAKNTPMVCPSSSVLPVLTLSTRFEHRLNSRGDALDSVIPGLKP